MAMDELGKELQRHDEVTHINYPGEIWRIDEIDGDNLVLVSMENESVIECKDFEVTLVTEE